MNNPCNNKISCPCEVSPFANLSSEAPDLPFFFAMAYVQIPPQIGSTGPTTAVATCDSPLSVADALNCATNGGTTTIITTTTPPGTNPPTTGQPVPSDPQSCTYQCPDNSPFTYTVPAGFVVDVNKASANIVAYQLACQYAAANFICFGELSTTQICTGQFYTIFIDASLASGGSSLVWSVIAGQLPPGMNLIESAGSTPYTGGTNAILGTPYTPGIYNFTLLVASQTTGQTASKAFTLQVAGLVGDVPDGELNVGYSFQLTAVGMTDPVILVLTGTPLPDGLAFDPTSNIIYGTPVFPGTFPITVKLQDGFSNFICIVPIEIQVPCATVTVPDAQINIPYTFTVPLPQGFIGGLFTLLDETQLPDGLTLDGPSGVISGTPTATVDEQLFILQIVDQDPSREASCIYDLQMGVLLDIITLPGGIVNAPYVGYQFGAYGFQNVAYTLIGGTLPPGMSLSSSGFIGGTPTITVLNTPLRVQLTNTETGDSATLSATLTVKPTVGGIDFSGTAWTVNKTNPGYPSNPYYFRVDRGPNNSYPWTGSFLFKPNGATVFASVTIDGAPGNTGDFAEGILAFNGSVAYSGPAANFTFASSIVVPYQDGVAIPFVPFNPGVYQVSATSGSTITFPGTITAFSEAVYPQGLPATATVTVTPKSVAIVTSGTPPIGNVGYAYNYQFSASGGVAPYTYSVFSGLLPPGLNLSPTGLISGTPTTVNPSPTNVSVAIKAADGFVLIYVVAIVIANVAITNGNPSPATVNVGYSFNFTATGGSPPYTWSVISGNLPTGLTLNSSTGVLSGTPTVVNTFNFTVQAQDTLGATATAPYSLVVASAGIDWTQMLWDVALASGAGGGSGAFSPAIVGTKTDTVNVTSTGGCVVTLHGTMTFTQATSTPAEINITTLTGGTALVGLQVLQDGTPIFTNQSIAVTAPQVFTFTVLAGTNSVITVRGDVTPQGPNDVYFATSGAPARQLTFQLKNQ